MGIGFIFQECCILFLCQFTLVRVNVFVFGLVYTQVLCFIYSECQNLRPNLFLTEKYQSIIIRVVNNPGMNNPRSVGKSYDN